MSRVIRINNHTEKLLNQYRNDLKKDFEKQNIKISEDICKNDNLILQSALIWAIETSMYVIPK